MTNTPLAAGQRPPGRSSDEQVWDEVPARWPDLRASLRTWARRPSAALGSGIVGLVLMHVLLRGWVLWGGSFFEDDYVYLAEARRGLSVGFLTQDYNGHLQVGQLLLVWVVARLAPLSHPVVAVGTLALSALAVALFARLLLLLFGPRRGILVPLAVYALCPIGANATTWWAAALQTLPLQVLLILAVDAHVRHTWTRERRWGWVAVASLVAGLFFWEKALLILPLLVGLTVLVLRPAGDRPAGGLLRRGARQLAPQARLWTAYVVAWVAYLGTYLAVTAPTGAGAGLWTTLGAVRTTVLDTFVVGLAGGPWRTEGTSPIPLSSTPYAPVLLLVLVVAVLVVTASIRWRGAAAGRVWLLLLGYLAADVGLLVATRLGLIGGELARDTRYVTDAVPVTALCLGLAFLPRRSTPPAEAVGPAARFAEVRKRSVPPLLKVPGVRLLVLGPLLVGYLGSCLLTTGALAHQASTWGASSYLSTLRASLADDPDAVLIDGPLPMSVMSPLTRRPVLSTVTQAMGVSRSYSEASEHPLTADLQGRLRPVALADPVVSEAGPVPGCGWAARGPVGVTVPLPRAAGGVVRLPYLLATTTRAVVEAAGQRYDVVLLAGLHDVYVPLPSGTAITSIRLRDLPLGARACVGPVAVGFAVPGP